MNVERVDLLKGHSKSTPRAKNSDALNHCINRCRINLLGAEGEEEQKGRGISTCATCDGAFFRDEEILVVGGGDLLWKRRLS